MGRLLQLRGESISLLIVNGGPLSLYGRLVTWGVGGGGGGRGGDERKEEEERN